MTRRKREKTPGPEEGRQEPPEGPSTPISEEFDEGFGSVWDSVSRKPVGIEALDLTHSYVQYLQSEETSDAQNEEKQLVSLDKTSSHLWRKPEGVEAPVDIDGQIQRCLERIGEGIMPQLFESRLIKLEKDRLEIQITKRNEDPFLSPEVRKRVSTLEQLWDIIRRSGDKDKQLVNIEAVLDAYRSGELTWTGLVTYWSNGNQLCEPRPFSWDEFETINKYYDGNRSFWTEGLDGPGPESAKYRFVVPASPFHPFLNTYNVMVRLPGVDWWEEFTFLYDTGSTMCRIYEDDLTQLQGHWTVDDPGHNIPIMGNVLAEEHSSFTGDRVVMVEVALRHPGLHETRLTPWVRIQCAVTGGSCPVDSPKRLDGPWIRYFMHTLTEPNGRNELYFDTQNRWWRRGTSEIPLAQRRLPRRDAYGGTNVNLRIPPAPWMRPFPENELPAYSAVDPPGGAGPPWTDEYLQERLAIRHKKSPPNTYHWSLSTPIAE
ncbi:hypothetical protein N7488_010745 [Penicillium malachiteum]|nr:hypothetical protein N7488_010745 [Penicillium malachiteum]